MHHDEVILDTETTGLNDGMILDEPVQIAVINHNRETLFYSLVKPSVPVSEGAAAVHGITSKALATAPIFAEIWPELLKAIANKTLVIYNAGYDIRILLNAAHAAGILIPPMTYRCAMLEYAKAFGKAHPDRPGEWKWWSLGAAYEQQFGYDPEMVLGAHDALTDCLMTADVVRAMEEGHLLRYRLGQTYSAALTTVQACLTRRGDAYAKFTSGGGQTVNVFNPVGFRLFEEKGVPVSKWIEHLRGLDDPDTVHTLKSPVTVWLNYDGAFPEVVRVQAADEAKAVQL
jgi:DNA polymerase-3 subunit epsilon